MLRFVTAAMVVLLCTNASAKATCSKSDQAKVTAVQAVKLTDKTMFRIVRTYANGYRETYITFNGTSIKRGAMMCREYD